MHTLCALTIHSILKKCMIHGLCSDQSPNEPCMEKNIRTKEFPKD